MKHLHTLVASAAGVVGLALLTGAPLLANQTQEHAPVTRADYTRAKSLLAGFDSAWSRGDLQAIMDPISPKFGCELYGEVDATQLRLVYQDLIEQLNGTRCATHVLRLVDDGQLIQATVCRQFTSARNQLVEEQCQLIYLRKELSELRIVGLEEFEHEGLEAIDGDTYRSPKSMFSFKIPSRSFVVPRPRLAFSLEHVLLRGEELRSEVEIFLLKTSRPFDLEQALDHDLEEWVLKNAPAKVETRAHTRVADYPAMRAEVRYQGAECSLAGRSEKASPRRLTRIYVQLDDTILLAVDMRAEASRQDENQALLSGLLASFEIDCPRDESYLLKLRQRRGWGRLKAGKFVSDAAGFTVQAPPGFELELSQGSSLFCLQVGRPASGKPRIRIDGVAMFDQALSIEELIEVDNAAASPGRNRSDNTRRTSEDPGSFRSTKRRVSGRSAVQVERPVDSPSTDQYETVVYVSSGPYLITVRVIGTLDQIRAASEDLEQILESISIR